MRTIIAGSRSIKDLRTIYAAVEEAAEEGIGISEVVSGTAGGVDTLGEVWAEENDIPVARFPAEWDNLDAPDAYIRINRQGKKYNVRAGFDRNERMAEYADALIAVWDGKSRGTQDMIVRARVHGLLVLIYKITEE